MRRAATALLLVLGAAACASRPQPVITGFRGVPWGASEDAVVGRLGQPWQRQDRGETERFLGFPAVVLGEHAAEPGLVVDRDSGLVRAGYIVRIRRFESACESAFDSVAALLMADYPSLQPRRKRHAPADRPFCRAVLDGQAEASVRMEDPASGAMMVAALEPGHDFLRVTYASPLAVRRAREAAPAANLPQAMR